MDAKGKRVDIIWLESREVEHKDVVRGLDIYFTLDEDPAEWTGYDTVPMFRIWNMPNAAHNFVRQFAEFVDDEGVAPIHSGPSGATACTPCEIRPSAGR